MTYSSFSIQKLAYINIFLYLCGQIGVGVKYLQHIVLFFSFMALGQAAMAQCPPTYSITDTIIAYDSLKIHPYQWFGQTYNEPGIYEDTLVAGNAQGCDSIGQLILRATYTDTIHVCGTTHNDTVFNTPWGEFTLPADCECLTGCMLHTLDFECLVDGEVCVQYDPCECDTTYSTTDVTFIYDSLQLHPFQWFGHSYSEPGVYEDTLFDANHDNCDSIGRLLLRVTYKDSALVCNDDLFTFHTPWGDYTTTDGCDCLTGCIQKTADDECVVDISLCVTRLITDTIKSDTTLCWGSSTIWHGQVIDHSGLYSDTLHFEREGAPICDSLIYLMQATVKPEPQHHPTSITLCEGMTYTWTTYHDSTITAAGIYYDTLWTDHGCYSDSYELTLLYSDHSASDTTAYVCYGDMPYLWHGKTLTKACDTTWITTNTSGCDSIVTLHLLVSPQPVEQNKDTAICDGSSYTWHEQIITSAGTYYDTTKVQTAGMTMCDSIWHKLTVSLRQPSTGDVYDTICYNQTYTWNGVEYKNKKESFTDQITLENAAECDSIVTLHVLVTAKPQSIIIDTTLCQGSSFEWYGNHVDHAGTYFGFVSSKIKPDCDSLYLNLKVTIKEPTASDTTAIACGSFTWHGNTYTTSGDYTWTTDNAVGCDSVRTLHLTINQPNTGDTTATACGSFTWHGTEYTTSAEPTWTYTNAAGCDSVVTLHLTINQPTTGDTTATACGSFTWHGTEYTTSAEPTWTYTNAAGCDSVVTLHLTINKPSTSETTVQICHDELPYRWNGEDYSAAGDYPYHTLNTVGCDSTATLHLNVIYCCPDTIMQQQTASICDTLMPYTWNTWRENILSETGFFTDTLRNERGCDSIIYTLTLDTFHCCAPLMADIHIDDICADATTLPVMLNLTGGEINEYTVHFTNPALNTMPLRDTTIRIETVYAGNEPIQLDIPIPKDPSDRTRYPRPDDSYTLDLTVRDVCGHSQMWTGMPFTIFYPSWITDQHWNDVIALLNDRYNGGYTFSHVEWLRNGEVMPGQDGLYIYLPHELWTNNMHQHEDFYYQARLTREDDGKAILTCPMWPEWRDSTNVLSDPYVSVYPTLVHKENPVVQILTNTTGTYWLYAADGKLIREADYEPCEHNAFDVAVPPIQAMYLFVFTPRGSDHPLRDKYRVVKIIVE